MKAIIAGCRDFTDYVAACAAVDGAGRRLSAMKWILPAILLSLTCCHEQAELIRPATAATAHAGIPASVVSNHDGDSLTVMMDGKKVKVRIEGIDAPEKVQRHGSDSKSA